MNYLMPRQLALDGLLLLLLVCSTLALPRLAYRESRGLSFEMDALPVMLPAAGLHEIEPLVDRSGGFRWTYGKAVLEPPNPGGPGEVRLVMASGTATTTPVLVQADAVSYAVAVGPGLRTYAFLFPAAAGERVPITIESPTMSVDGRDLGVMISQLRIVGGSATPMQIPLALVIASVSGFVTLRRAGGGRLLITVIVGSLQFLAVAWLAFDGWRYALFGPILLLASGASLAALVIERIWPPHPPTPTPALPLSRRDWSLLALLLILALAMSLPWLAVPDPVGDLELAARRMGFMANDGWAGAFSFGGDYMPLRLGILYGLSFPVRWLGGAFWDSATTITYAFIKLPSVLANLGIVTMIFFWSRRFCAWQCAALIAALYALTPPIWINAAWWGQVDALLMLPMIGAVVGLDRFGGRRSWMLWASALLIKPQAIILAPLLYIATLRRYGSRGLVEGGALAMGLIVIAYAPLALAGQGPGAFQAAVGSVGRFPQVTNRAYNLWYIVSQGAQMSDVAHWLGPFTYRTVGLILVAGAALVVGIALLRRVDGPVRVEGAAALALAFFVLPTQIHERYAFLALPFLAMGIASSRALLVPYAILTATATLNILGALRGFWPAATGVIKPSALPLLVSWINVIVLVGLLLHLLLIASRPPSIQETIRPSSAS